MNNRRLFFILVKFNYQKYRSRKYHALIDTGANLTVAKYNVLPPELWKRKQKMLRMESAGKEIHMIELESRNAYLRVEGKGLSSKLSASLDEEGLGSSSFFNGLNL